MDKYTINLNYIEDEENINEIIQKVLEKKLENFYYEIIEKRKNDSHEYQ